MVSFGVVSKNVQNFRNGCYNTPTLPITYLCEAGFLAYASTKTTYYNRMSGRATVRIQLFSNELDIKDMYKKFKTMSQVLIFKNFSYTEVFHNF